MPTKNELRKQAQALLAQARGLLLSDAARLAEEGAFRLDFEAGTYIPKSMFDRKPFEAEALERLKVEGIYRNGLAILWEDATGEQQLDALEEAADELMRDEIGLSDDEWSANYDAGTWWMPNAC